MLNKYYQYNGHVVCDNKTGDWSWSNKQKPRYRKICGRGNLMPSQNENVPFAMKYKYLQRGASIKPHIH